MNYKELQRMFPEPTYKLIKSSSVFHNWCRENSLKPESWHGEYMNGREIGSPSLDMLPKDIPVDHVCFFTFSTGSLYEAGRLSWIIAPTSVMDAWEIKKLEVGNPSEILVRKIA